MRILAGTSGFSYKEWKGSFYPEDLPAKAMLRFYAERLPIVEINNTFYRLPRKEQLAQWRTQVPEGFRFAVKAPQRITHRKRLVDCAEEVASLFEALEVLGDSLGSVLFQLPPYARAAPETLDAFLASLPAGTPAAFEFRHDSWHVQEVLDALAARNCALVMSQTDERPQVDLRPTADWAYLRLRKTAYEDAELRDWIARLGAAQLTEAHVFFKHEDEGSGPRFAARFLDLAEAARAR
jgi:uncharacterized protein YecE (DUF72 family)